MSRFVAFLSLFVPALLISGILSAQESQDEEREWKGLLWEISGNGLEKPSYLFGTMHLRDEKVFNFNDSVMQVFLDCQAFAMEVHPDSILESMFSSRWGFYGSGWRRKKPFSIERFLESSPINESFMNSYSRKRSDKEMDTFLDAWFYDLARRKGKKIYGLEDINDHLEAGSSTSRRTRYDEFTFWDFLFMPMKMNQMVDAYADEDLDFILNWSRDIFTAEYYKELLTDRNVIMADQIDSLSHIEPTFIAVGSGHLPGDSGVVELLEAKGYSMRPIMTAKNKAFKQYAHIDGDFPWPEIGDKAIGYTLQMPSKAMELPYPGFTSPMHYWMDIGTGINYFAFSAALPGTLDSTDLCIYSDSLQSIFLQASYGELVEEKDIEHQGYPGRELFLQEDDNEIMLVRYYLVDHWLYAQLVTSINPSFRVGDVRKFFREIDFFPSEDRDWDYYSSDVGAFKVKIPVSKSGVPDVVPGKKKGSTWIKSVDPATGFSFHANYNAKRRNYHNDFDIDFSELSEASEGAMKGHDLKKYFENLRKELDIDQLSTDVEVDTLWYGLAHQKTIGRGNRNYQLLAFTDSSKAGYKAAEDFFDSFEFTPYLFPDWQAIEGDPDFTADFPGKALADTITREGREYNWDLNAYSNHQVAYSCVDSNSGQEFFIRKDSMSQFFHKKGEKGFFDWVVDVEIAYNDSVLSRSEFSDANPSLEIIYGVPGSLMGHRMKAIIQGSKLYRLSVSGELDWLDSEEIGHFFDSFQLRGDGDDFDFALNKEEKLLQALADADTNGWREVYRALEFTQIDSSHLPDLHHALHRSYPDGSKTTLELLSQIGYWEDSLSVEPLMTLYANTEDDEVRYECMKILAEIGTKGALEELKLILQDDLPEFDEREEKVSVLMGRLRYNLPKSSLLIPELLKLIKQEDFTYSVCGFLTAALDSSAVTKEELEKEIPIFIDLVEEEMEAREDIDYYRYGKLEASVELIGYFVGYSQVDSLLNKLAVNRPSLAMDAVRSILKGGEVPSDEVLNQLGENDHMRLPLYETLKEFEQVSAFPSKYLNQEAFARSSLAGQVLEDGFSDYAIRFVQDTLVEYKRDTCRFFIYEVDVNDQYHWDRDEVVGEEILRSMAKSPKYSWAYASLGHNRSYWGVSGAYPRSQTDLELVGEIAVLDYDEGSKAEMAEFIAAQIAEETEVEENEKASKGDREEVRDAIAIPKVDR